MWQGHPSSHQVQPEQSVDKVRERHSFKFNYHKLNPFSHLISDSAQADWVINMQKVSKLNTKPFNSSPNAGEPIQIQAEFCFHPHIQMHIKNLHTVSTSYLSPLEHMSTSHSSTCMSIPRNATQLDQITLR